MSNKHDVDKLFKKSFEQHVEKTDLQDWNSFAEFKAQMDKEDNVPAPIFWTRTRLLAVVSIFVFTIGGIFWLSSDNNAPLVKEIDNTIAQQKLNKPVTNPKNLEPIEKADGIKSENIVETKQIDSIKDNPKNKQVENQNSISSEIKSVADNIRNVETQKTIVEIQQNKFKIETVSSLGRELEVVNEVDNFQIEGQATEELVVQENTLMQSNTIASDYKITTTLPITNLSPLANAIKFDDASKLIRNEEKVEVEKNRSQLFTVGLSFELYPYESGTDKLLSYNLNLGYQKGIYPRGALVANVSYSYRLGSYAYTQQENYIQFRYAKEQTNYAIVPEGLNLLGLSLALRHNTNKGAFYIGLGSDYLLSAVGRLYSNTNSNGVQSSSAFAEMASKSNLGVVDKEGLGDWQVVSFIGYEMPLSKRLAFQFRFNYILKALADQNGTMENILIEDNPFLGELGLNYNF